MSIVTRKRASKVLSAAAIATAALAGMQSARGSLVVSLSLSNTSPTGSSTDALTGAADVPVYIWATVTGTQSLAGGTYFDGLKSFYANVASSYTGPTPVVTSGSGFNANAVFPIIWKASGYSTTVAHTDVNGDGITDLGASGTSSTATMFKPNGNSQDGTFSATVYNNDDATSLTKVVGTSSVSFLMGSANFHVTGVQTGSTVTLTPKVIASAPSNIQWYEDSTDVTTNSGAQNGSSTRGYSAGAGVSFTYTAPGGNPIISLTSSASPTGFGNQVTHVATPTAGDKAVFDAGSASNSTLTVVRASAGQYSEATALHVNNSAGAGADFVKVSGFTGGEQEIFALGVAVGSQLTTVGDPSVGGSDAAKAKVLVDAINAQSATDGGIVALNLLDSSTNASLRNFFGSQFAVALEETPGTAAGSLGWNVANGTGLSSYTVTDVAAIPEPATAGLAAIGSGILLLRRRRSAR